jgi:hypothetical protein
MRGRVTFVDSQSSPQDWFAADVKLYKTLVAIDEPIPGLKPGLSAEVTIVAWESPEDVLQVPVQAVLGSISEGVTRKCFVIGAGGQPEEREIVLGMSNDRTVEVRSGLAEGEKVVLNPRSLLPEDGDEKAQHKSDEPGAGSGSQGSGKGNWKGGAKGSFKDGAGKGSFKDGTGKGGFKDGAGKGGAKYDKAAIQKKFAALEAAVRKAPAAERRQVVSQHVTEGFGDATVEQARDFTIQILKKKGIEIPD